MSEALKVTRSSLAKRLALVAFRVVRSVQHTVVSIPGAARSTARDVRDAWHETANSRPNA